MAEESPSPNQNNPNKIDTDDKKSLKQEKIKEELKKLNLDKKSIDKIILNYSLEDIEGKIDLINTRRNVLNPAGWLILALQANYLNPESYREENDEEEKIIETEEVESVNKVIKPEKINLEKKPEEEKAIPRRKTKDDLSCTSSLVLRG